MRYRVYGREMTVRTNFIDADFAIAERRADVPHARRRSRSASPRSHAGAARRLEDVDLGAARCTRAACRIAIARPTTTRSSIRRSSPATRPIYSFTVQGIPHFIVNVGEGGIWDGQKTGRRRPEDRRDGRRLLGHDSVREVRVLQPDHGSERRPGAQERVHADDEPLESTDAARLRRLADARQPRVLPRVEREAPATGRARTVRLRPREPDALAVGRRGPHELLRRSARGARGRHHPR